ncbi:MAG: hypothetical protein Q7V01_15450 [Vicinamibacterales bacterium]|nr:hypothetical protein [Vicinamibacterales bacterium]
MARGWESKAIESQQADHAREAAGRKDGVASANERVREARRKVLVLARARTAGDLTKAEAPAQQDMLKRALADLDDAIAALSLRPS